MDGAGQHPRDEAHHGRVSDHHRQPCRQTGGAQNRSEQYQQSALHQRYQGGHLPNQAQVQTFWNELRGEGKKDQDLLHGTGHYGQPV